MVAATKRLYRYKKIDDGQIRLLKFVQDGDCASAVLQTFSVKRSLPRYCSISYTWATDGTSNHAKDHMIEIDKRQLPVLNSLKSFFEALRAKGMLLNDTWWWIDSICIDQSNVQEIAHQVQLMQLIYRQAEQVIVWLGEPSSDSDLAVDFIKFLDKTTRTKPSVAEVRSMLQQDQYRTHWTALTNFLKRSWWSRIWTVQEFVLPQSVSFWCGMRNVSRVAVCRSISTADKCTFIRIKEDMAFMHANSRRRAWSLYKAGKNPRVHLTLSLPALAAYFCCMDATDDRDRLYGLMALSTDQFLPYPDYRLEAEEVYLRFTQAFIAHHKSLDIICLASTSDPSKRPSRPSWVPDWQKRYPQVIPSMASQSSRTDIGNLRTPMALDVDPLFYWSASKNTEAVFTFEGSALIARGVIVDAIDGLAGSKNYEMVQSTQWESPHSDECPRSATSAEDTLMSICRTLVLDRGDRYLRYPMPSKAFFQDFIHLLVRAMADQDSSGPNELKEWFEWIKCLRIRDSSFESIWRDCPTAGIDPPDTAPNEDEYYHDTFFGRFFDTVVRWSLRLMVSRNGHIGMAVERAMKGDLICVLLGCSIPVLLRKSADRDTFKLIGECFLDGHMDGSVLGQSELPEREFLIL